MFYTYILECSDGTFYTGWTNDLDTRLTKHNTGKGAKYTKSRSPSKLKAYWIHPSKSEAMKHEYQIKQLSRIEKEKLITGWQN